MVGKFGREVDGDQKICHGNDYSSILGFEYYVDAAAEECQKDCPGDDC